MVRDKLAIASAAVHRVNAAARGWRGCVIYCCFRRSSKLTGAGNALDAWALATGRPAHAVANLRGIHVKLREGATQGVAVHAKLFGGLALVSLVVREHLENVALLELPNGVRVGDARAVHLSNESVQFALQGYPRLQSFPRLHSHCDSIGGI